MHSNSKSPKLIIGSFIFLVLYTGALLVFADPPTTKYQPGEILDPTCGPGDTNCSVQTVEVERGTGAPASTPTGLDPVVYVDEATGNVYSWDGSTWNLITSGGGSGTVTSVGLTVPTGFSVSGSPITSSGTLAITTALSGVLIGTGSGFSTATISSPLTYSSSTLSINNAAADGTTKGAASFTAADFNATSGLISLDYTNGQAASGSTKGFLTAADWTTFSGKVDGSGTDTQVAYWNNSGDLTGSSNFVWSGTNLTVTGNVIPGTNDTYDLGSTSSRWQDLYLGPGSLHVGATGDEGVVSFNTTSNTLAFSAAGGVTLSSMDAATRDAISSPATGALIYNTDDDEFNYYDGSVWTTFGGGSPAGSDTQVQFNDEGLFGADAGFLFDKDQTKLSVVSGNSLTGVSVGDPDFTGAGLDDLTTGGNYTGITNRIYTVTIDDTNADIVQYTDITGGITKLHDFTGTDGRQSSGPLSRGLDGLLYGTTNIGGTSNQGTIYSYNPTTDEFLKRYDFNGTKGAGPDAGLVIGSDGLFYGATLQGGVSDYGVLFSFNPTTNVVTKLHEFTGTDGEHPYAALVLGSDDIFYGATLSGGTTDQGTLYSFNPNTGIFTKLHDFSGTDGAQPYAKLVRGPDGLLYGTTQTGGTAGKGVIYSFNTTTHVVTKVHDFDGTNGENPNASLVLATNGLFYGTTTIGGTSSFGVLFSFDPDTNTFTKLHDFDGTNGKYSYTPLFLDEYGVLFGLTTQGGTSNKGVIFSYTIDTSTYKKVYSFNGTNGQSPYGSFTQGSDGLLYGSTVIGGTSNYGTFYSFNPHPSFTVGDTLTDGTSGATATIESDNGYSVVASGVSGTYSNGDSISDAHGVSATVVAQTTADTFTWTDGTTTRTEFANDTSPISLSYGVTVLFGATTGHTNGNSWQFRATAGGLKGIFTLGKEIRFMSPDDSNSFVGFRAPNLFANTIWTLPEADGTAGQVLATDGLRTLSWVDRDRNEGLIGSTSGLSNTPTAPGPGTETWLGDGAGANGGTVDYTVFVGAGAGDGANNVPYSSFLGHSAGFGATDAADSVFIGYSAGYGATDAVQSNFIGTGAGSLAVYSESSNFFGLNAGAYGVGIGSEKAANSIFIGTHAGYLATDSGLDNTSTNTTDDCDTVDCYSILIGNYASTGGYSNSIALGSEAINDDNNQFVIGSTDYPIDEMIIIGSGGQSCTFRPDTGSPSCTSDERLKTNIIDLGNTTLEKLLNVRTVTYNWKEGDTDVTHIGFLAQDLMTRFPELVSTGPGGFLQVNYAGITPILTEAIRELDIKLTDITKFATSENKTFLENLIAWLGDTANGITHLFAKNIHSEESHTDKLCVGETCVTENQLQQLLQNNSILPQPEPTPSAPTPTTQEEGTSDDNQSPLPQEQSQEENNATPETETPVTVEEPVVEENTQPTPNDEVVPPAADDGDAVVQ